MIIRIPLCSLEFFPKNVKPPKTTVEHGESPTQVAGRRALRTHSRVPSSKRRQHLPPTAPPDVLTNYYCRRSYGTPSSTAVYTLFIRRRNCRAAGDRMARPLNMKGVYLLVQIHQDMIPRSFGSKICTFHMGNERNWRRGQCAYGNSTWR